MNCSRRRRRIQRTGLGRTLSEERAIYCGGATAAGTRRRHCVLLEAERARRELWKQPGVVPRILTMEARKRRSPALPLLPSWEQSQVKISLTVS